jgi:MSHA pilin protein MshA
MPNPFHRLIADPYIGGRRTGTLAVNLNFALSSFGVTSMIRTEQRGFTLIELVVVIVILGILAAFAVPRFMGLENKARAASVQAIAGSMESAESMAHGVWEASGSPATILVNGSSITMTNGYPDYTSIQSLLQDTTGYTVTASSSPATFVPNGGGATCEATYANAAANGMPTITQVVSGC